jgi:hypothetical protein
VEGAATLWSLRDMAMGRMAAPVPFLCRPQQEVWLSFCVFGGASQRTRGSTHTARVCKFLFPSFSDECSWNQDFNVIVTQTLNISEKLELAADRCVGIEGVQCAADPAVFAPQLL